MAYLYYKDGKVRKIEKTGKDYICRTNIVKYKSPQICKFNIGIKYDVHNDNMPYGEYYDVILKRLDGKVAEIKRNKKVEIERQKTLFDNA